MLRKGDCVRYFEERGIVVHENDPCIMRTVDFHSYVPIVHLERCQKLDTTKDEECDIKPELVERIREYLRTTAHELPTGTT